MSALSELGRLKGRGKGLRKENRAAYIFLAPWLLGLLLITIGPMLASLYLSFTDYNLIQAPKWIGAGELHPDARRRAAAQLAAR